MWTVLPIRGESAGKTRLAPALDRAGRMRINRRLLRGTLDAIESWQGTLAQCVVVSACKRTLATARARGAVVLQEPMPRRGLNRAVALGVRVAARRGARRVLVLPGDLARISASALRRLACVARSARAVIAPDRGGTGTNALAVPAAARIRFAYGAGSFARHLEGMRRRGWNVVVCDHPRLRFDLDTPQDLDECRARGRRAAARGPMV
jgi:2-phospho-L-lactate guanylyltransferase